MAYSLDKRHNIVLPRGDTMEMPVKLNGVRVSEGTQAVFGIVEYDRAGNRKQIFQKSFALKPAEDGGECSMAVIRLSHSETEGLAAGKYRWDMRIATGAEMVDGEMVLDDADTLDSVFALRPGGMPLLTVAEVGADV